MVPRTQGLIDGILWAINDHPDWVLDAWLTLQNHLNDTARRYSEINTEMGGLAAQLSKGSTASTTLSSAARGTPLDRERTYRAHAAVQDIYIAFCVVDSLLKNICVEGEVALRSAVEAALPRLVAEYMPIFSIPQSRWCGEAVDEYRYLFLDLLNSWLVLNVLQSDVHRRIQEYIQHRLHRSRAEVVEGDTKKQAALWNQGVQAIIEQAAGPSTALPSSSLQSGGGHTGAAKNATLKPPPARTAEAVEKTVRSFLNSIFPPRRTPASRHRCPHCGALFRDEKSRAAHSRYHFYARNFLKPEDKLVRLMYPTAVEFIDHCGDSKKEGHFTKVTEVLEQAYKGGERGAVKIRKLEELVGSERSDGV